MMDYAAAKFWLEVLLLIGMVGNAIYTWIVTRQGANKSEIEDLKKENRGLEQRLLIQEAKLDALPGARDFHNALQQMTKMDGEIGILNERLAGFKESMERVERPLNLLVEAQMKGAKS
ncbi:DUF2730 family protein [Magnetovibrio sp.]|uniref:DUF2730 family protein n=1 Tax=Magnetovibrio sp. TaxID=2024836 RepID=UPI002F9537DA